MRESLGIAGSGAIACGLAEVAAARGQVVMWARSDASARRAREALGDSARVETDLSVLGDATFVVESVVEDADVKTRLLRQIGQRAGEQTILATTTSALSVTELAEASGRPDRFVALHVFNPVPKMALVELCFPPEATEQTRRRATALCEAFGKTAVEVPDTPGFVVNRLLFPYLFSAVDLLERTELDPEAVDACMTLGAGHPMGPLRLLDFVGIDVAVAIGSAIDAPIPPRLRQMLAAGELGKKSGRGFYSY